jgi:AraC-like DNA-binding protein
MNIDTVIVESLQVIKTKITPKLLSSGGRDFNSLSFRVSGENVIFSKGEKYYSNENSLTLVPEGTEYTHEVLSPSEQIIVHFTTRDKIGGRVEVFSLPPYSNIANLFNELYSKWEIRQTPDNVECMAIFYNILSIINTHINKDKLSQNIHIWLNDAINYINVNFKDCNFNLSQLYDYLHISPAYFRRIFKKTFNCTPIEYLKRIRINYAKQLLVSGYYTVNEVAEMSGFSASTYFSYEFKKATNCAPSRYLKDL